MSKLRFILIILFLNFFSVPLSEPLLIKSNLIESDVTYINKASQNPSHVRFFIAPSQTKDTVALILGYVVDSITGNPISNCTIIRSGSGSPGSTDENGYLTFTTDKSTCTLSVKCPDYLPLTFVSTPAKQSVNSFQIKLFPDPLSPRCAKIKGLIKNNVHEKISNANVKLIETDQEVLSDSLGFFVVPCATQGLNTISIEAIGHKVFYHSFQTSGTIDTTFLNLLLTKFENDSSFTGLRGYIYSSSGSPLQNATVSLANSKPLATTDFTGFFQAYVPSEELCTLKVTAENFVDYTEIVSSHSKLMLNIFLTPLDSQVSQVAAGTSTIEGTVKDQANLFLDSVTVSITLLSRTTLSDTTGSYRFMNIPSGKYTVYFSKQGYPEKSLIVSVPDSGKIVTLNSILENNSAEELSRMTVVSSIVKNSGESMLKLRQNSFSISDAVAVQEMSRAGAGNAAEAVKMITGVTIVDGKYPVIRGLGDRYITTTLNNIELPSSDPDRRSVSLDIFPSGLLDNIDAVKTFTPDMSGNFSGGTIKIQTKQFPEKPTFSVSAKVGSHQGTTFNSNFLSEKGGKLDWLGIDDGTRDIPDELQGRVPWAPNITNYYNILSRASRMQDSSDILAASDPAQAGYYSNLALSLNDSARIVLDRIDEVAKSFSTPFSADTTVAKPDFGIQLSSGTTLDLVGNPLGLSGTFTYDYKNRASTNIRRTSWKFNPLSPGEPMENDLDYISDKFSNGVLWGGLLNAGIKLFESHEFSALYMYTQSADKNASFSQRINFENNPEILKHELSYKERSFHFSLLSGKNTFDVQIPLSLDWRVGYSRNSQNEPDSRIISYGRAFTPADTMYDQPAEGDIVISPPDTLYQFHHNIEVRPQHRFRSVNENVFDLGLDLNARFFLSPFANKDAQVQTGFSLKSKKRNFRQSQFEVVHSRSNGLSIDDVDGNPNLFVAPSNMGVITDSTGKEKISHIIAAVNDTSANHVGYDTTVGIYGMLDIPVFDQFRLVLGGRYEISHMRLKSWNTLDSNFMGDLLSNDFLPSFASIWQPYSDINVRLSYGRTIIRPIFREKAGYDSYDFVLKSKLIGNSALQITDIDNFDFRAEWFPSNGEIVAFSAFVKKLTNPVTRSFYDTENNYITFVNVQRGFVQGVEFEARKRLDFLPGSFKYFQTGGNLTLLRSGTTITDIKKKTLQYNKDSVGFVYHDPSDPLPLDGASPYVANFNIIYDYEPASMVVALYYNVIGPRLDYITNDATPDSYEQAQSDFNFSISKKINRFSVKLSGKNIIDQPVNKNHSFKNSIDNIGYSFEDSYLRESFHRGRSFSVNVGYDIK